ncbi:hypothetical protein LCGC14_0275390 [marine sediment metagenome]|uniref:Uncharacterized protein n=1 Tax=marine sediment metagenome TaxID=412755 RepID=A0A0F9U2D1_9ZZZZ
MPYTIVMQGGQHCVFKKSPDGTAAGKSMGCHDSREAAVAQIGAIESSEERRQKDLLVQLVADLAWRLGMNTGAIPKDGSVQHHLQLPRVGVVSWPVKKENALGSPLVWLDEVAEITPETWDKIATYLAGKTHKGWGMEHSHRQVNLSVDKVLSEQEEGASVTEETRKSDGTSVLPAPALLDIKSGGQEKAVLEDGVGTCVCKECGYSGDHSKGAACVDKVCPDCGAPLMGTRAKPKSWKDKFSQVWSSLGQMLTKELAPEPAITKGQNVFFTTKQHDGQYRWVSISSTAFMDREFDIVSSKALERSADSVVKDRGPLRFWHVRGVDFGNCDFAMHDGLCLIESGLWYNDAVSQQARKETSRHPERWAISIAFLSDPTDKERNVDVRGKRVNNVYHSIAILERSLLPVQQSANVFSRITTEGEPEMLQHKIAILRELLGDELATKAVSQADGINAKSVEPDAIFKDEEISRDNLVKELLMMVDAEENEDHKQILKSAAVFVSHIPDQEEKEDTQEPDPNDLFIKAMGDLPDCELKVAFLSLAEKAKKKKQEDEEEDEDDEDGKDGKAKKKAKEVASDPPNFTADEGQEALAGLVKEMSDQLASVSFEVQALRRNQSTRASLTRPSTDPKTVDPNATVAAKEKADQESVGAGVVQDMGDALMDTFLGGGNKSG